MLPQQICPNLFVWFDLRSTDPIIRRIPLTCYFFNLRFPVVTSENILGYAPELCQACDGLDKAIYCHLPCSRLDLSADPWTSLLQPDFTLSFFWNVHVPCIIYLYNTFSGSPIIEVTSNPGKEMPQTCWTRAELGRSTERTWEPLWDNQQLTAKGFFIVSNPRMCELAQPRAGAAGDRDKPPWGKHELKSSNLKCQSCKNGI